MLHCKWIYSSKSNPHFYWSSRGFSGLETFCHQAETEADLLASKLNLPIPSDLRYTVDSKE